MTFFKSDREYFENESNCYLYCIDNAFDLVEDKEFAMAASYYENAARSLRELQKMKDAKQELDKKWLEIKQAEGQQIVDQWIMKSRGRA